VIAGIVTVTNQGANGEGEGECQKDLQGLQDCPKKGLSADHLQESQA